jgi:hypothetical protein
MSFFRIVATGVLGAFVVGGGVWARDGDWSTALGIGFLVGAAIATLYGFARRLIRRDNEWR